MQCVAICANVAVPITFIFFFFAMNLKDVLSTVIKNSWGFYMSSVGDVQDVIKTCARGNKTIAYSDFNDCLSVLIFDGDIVPLEVALG